MILPVTLYGCKTWSHTLSKEHRLKDLYAVENNIFFVTCSQRLVPHADTLHQLVETGKKVRKMTQPIKIFFHMHQGVFITTTHFTTSVNTKCQI